MRLNVFLILASLALTIAAPGFHVHEKAHFDGPEISSHDDFSGCADDHAHCLALHKAERTMAIHNQIRVPLDIYSNTRLATENRTDLISILIYFESGRSPPSELI